MRMRIHKTFHGTNAAGVASMATKDRWLPASDRGYAAIGLVRPKNHRNEGGIMRAAHCFGASLIVMQGARYKHQSSNVTSAEKHIPLLHVDDICSSTPYNCQKVAVELVDGATDLRDFNHPERAFYIFGAEDGTLSRELVGKCQHVVSIPTAYCLNLAATVNVVLYDRLLKMRSISDRLAA